MCILPLALPTPKLAHDVPIYALTPQYVLVRDEPLKPDGPASVDPPRADTDLSTKAIAETICKAGARVYEYARRVDTAYKCAARCIGLRHDAVRVVRAVRVDVRNCSGERRHGAHGERQ